MNSLELRIPPPLVALVTAIVMWLTSLAVAPIALPVAIRAIVGVVLAAIGIGTAFAGARAFKQAKTTLNPTTPAAATSLVRSGIFRVTRNPMYLGVLIALLGWATFLANGVAYLVAPLFVFYINRFQIRPEERVLSSLFAKEYADYVKAVRRWI